MSSSESVTEWLAGLKRGDPQAAQRLWERYVERLVRLAARKLSSSPRRAADEEDVVVAAFTSFRKATEAGRFAKLDDRDDLWQVLVMLTEHKAFDQRRREYAEKRGRGQVRGESGFEVPDASVSPAAGLGQVVDGEPTPAFAAEAAEELTVLLGGLPDETLRRIALAKLEGYTSAEIATQLGLGLRTVERRLNLIRQTWEETFRED